MTAPIAAERSRAELEAFTARAVVLADRVLEATVERALERQIRGKLLGAYQAVAHTLADHWVTGAAVRTAATAPATDDRDRMLATTVGALDHLRALVDDAVRLRGAQGYLVGDIASEARLEYLQLTRDLGPRDALLEELGRPTRRSLRDSNDTTAHVNAVLDGVWDPAKALHADTSGCLHNADVHRAVAAAGWLGVFVAHAHLNPKLDTADAFAIAETLTIAGVPIHALNTTAMVAALVRDLGTDHLRHEVLEAARIGGRGSDLGFCV